VIGSKLFDGAHAAAAATAAVADLSLYIGLAMLQNDMEFLRVRSAKHEVMVAPSKLLLDTWQQLQNCCSRSAPNLV
jgi:hypothetical protein